MSQAEPNQSGPRIEPGGLRLSSGLLVSFQRYQRPAGHIIAEAPPSLGTLPVGNDGKGQFAVPVADGEAFWIGLDPVGSGHSIRLAIGISVADGRVLDPVSGKPWPGWKQAAFTVSSTCWIDGIRRLDGRFAPLSRVSGDGKSPWCQAIILHIARSRHENTYAVEFSKPCLGQESQTFHVGLVDYSTFTEQSGQAPPAPLDLEAGYQRWLLP